VRPNAQLTPAPAARNAKEQKSFCFFFFRKRRIFLLFFSEEKNQKTFTRCLAGLGAAPG
jgi:hypothetical protein